MKLKLLFIFGVVGLLLAALLAASTLSHGAASTNINEPEADKMSTALPRLLPSGQPSFYNRLDTCGQGAVYTSLPAKCLTSQGLRPVVTPASRGFIAITPNR